MINVLIVDDEPVIRKGIRSILSKNTDETAFSWLEAETGFEAVEVCKKHNPEIIITDLHLPQMNGLEFIEKVKSAYTHSAPSFIIVTGYDNFSYAKTAIKLGVMEYLLKPIKKNELLDAFFATVANINMSKQNRSIKIENELLKHENLELNKRKCLNRVVANLNNEEKREAIEFLAVNNMLAQANFYQCVVCQMKEAERDIDKTVQLCSEKISALTSDAAVFFDNNSNVVIILTGEVKLDMSLQVERIINNLPGHLLKQSGITSFLGIGNPVRSIANIFISYTQALSAALRKITATQGHYYWEETDASAGTKSRADFIMNLPIFIEMGDYDNAVGLIDEEIKRADGNFLQLFLLYENFDFVVKTHFGNWLNDKEFILNKFSSFWSEAQFEEYLHKFVFRLCKEVHKSNINCEKETVLKVLKFISDHYRENINLNLVSNVLDKNSSYLSTLIKKETGEKFTDILLKYKINYAKELLQEVNYSINEVSAKCGFISTKHFIAVFKKITGKRPTEFRVDSLKHSSAPLEHGEPDELSQIRAN